VEFHLLGLAEEGQRAPEPRTGYTHVYIEA
jgi:hypothetical protein